jgi:hypothetical protein
VAANSRPNEAAIIKGNNNGQGNMKTVEVMRAGYRRPRWFRQKSYAVSQVWAGPSGEFTSSAAGQYRET